MNLTGARIVIECLLEQGVDTVFGYPGGAILNIYDELYKNQDKLRHILTAHEQGAAHAADGYARATGKVGVCLATSGPGATNLVTGIATAYMDSIPMVAITCNVPCSLLGRDSFQEVDIAGITMPITKHNYIVKDISTLANTIREAFVIAKSGRCGPVLIDIPKDVTAQKTEYTKMKEPPSYSKPLPNLKEKDILKAIRLINDSERPFIVAGGGVISSNAAKELYRFAKKLNCPVATTFMGTGSYPCDDDFYTGMIGMHGTKASNLCASRSDLLIAIGARFSDRVTSDSSKFAKTAQILHIDIDEAEIGKNIGVNHYITGDAKNVLNLLYDKINKKGQNEFNQNILKWKNQFPNMDSEDSPLNPQFIMKKIYEATQGKAIITTEVGQNQMWASQFFNYTEPRTFLSSGGLGTMGFGTGASIGAQIGVPDKQVVAVAGDGSFRMNCNELATISAYNIPVIIVIMNNEVLGMVRQWQTLFYGKRYSSTNLDRAPNFKMLAQAYGIKGYEVTTKVDFEMAICEAVSKRQPAVIDAHINKDEFVLPMVEPGKPIRNLISKIDI